MFDSIRNAVSEWIKPKPKKPKAPSIPVVTAHPLDLHIDRMDELAETYEKLAEEASTHSLRTAHRIRAEAYREASGHAQEAQDGS